jgi:hypothetical protein
VVVCTRYDDDGYGIDGKAAPLEALGKGKKWADNGSKKPLASNKSVPRKVRTKEIRNLQPVSSNLIAPPGWR